MLVALVAAVALAAPWPFDDVPAAPSVPYDGAFDAPPVPHWSAPLPGERLNVGSHTEHTRPIVVGDHVLVGAAGGRALYMLSRTNGVLVRSFPADGSVESEPTLVGERVVFGDTGGTTWCYELDGTLIWSHRSGAAILMKPTIIDGRVYVTNVDDLGYALDAETGALEWRYAHKADITRDAELALYAAP